MEFISWHYTQGINYYFKSVSKTLEFYLHYFSLGLLIKTLFAPWKRLIVEDKSPGFNLQKKFEVFTFNLISRGVGAVVRFLLILVGIVSILLILIGSTTGILFWLLIPFFSYPVFKKHKKSLNNFIESLFSQIEGSQNHLEVIFSSEAGIFVSSHLGVDYMDFVQNAKIKKFDFTGKKFENFTEIVDFLLAKNIWEKEFFSKRSIEEKDLILASKWYDKNKIKAVSFFEDSFKKPAIPLELTFGYTPILNKYCFDLSLPKSFSHHLIGRSEIVSRIERVLSSGMSVILVGEPGVGKKTIVLEFARRAVGGELGKKMSYKRVLEFDYNLILSQSFDISQKKASLSETLEEAAYAGNVILMIRDIHRLVNPSVEGYDFTDIFEKHLQKGDLKIIAVSTTSDYERFVVPNLKIRKFLEKVEATPPTKEESLEIILEVADRWERLTQLTILVPALRHIINESDRYITETPFPEKALELLDQIVVYSQSKGIKVVGIDQVNAVLSEKTGIPFSTLTSEEKLRLKNIEEVIHQRLVNQETAVELIGKTLRAKTLGVIKENRPLGSFLFLGPTGVGKTETAKVLAKVYYGSEENMIRFDMAEYRGTEGLERLIGSVGKNLPGALTTAIKNRPASILLLDEIEKASEEIYNLFLSLLDEGIITDAFGKKVICRHLFVIGTSNAGAEYVRELVNKGVVGEELQSLVVNYCLEKEIFSPEFLNRFDGVVVYEPLEKKHLIHIANLMLLDLKENLSKKNILLEINKETIEKIAEDGYNPTFGARPMKRIVNLVLGNLIGKAILNGEIKEGDRIKIIPKQKKEEFVIEKILNK